MNGYGRHVLAAAPVSWSTPVFNPSYYAQPRPKANSWRTELEDARELLHAQKRLRKDRALLGQLHSLADVLASRNKPPPPPPPPDRFAEVLGYLAKQQETLTELVRGVVEDRKETRQYMQGQFMAVQHQQQQQYQSLHHSQMHPIEEEYRRIQKNPSEFKQIMAELDFNDDETEMYIDADKKFKFNPDLSPDQKAAIMQQVRANREAQRHREIKRTIRGKRRFKVLGWTVMFPILLRNSVMYRRTVMRDSNIKQMQDSIKVYAEVAHSWVMKAARMPIVSVLNDPTLDLNILGTRLDNAKFLKLQVRIKGLIQGFVECTNSRDMAGPLRLFIDRYVANGASVPPKSLLPYERSRLEWDQFGALVEQNRDRQHMMVCFFFVTRHLIDMLLRPKENSLNARTEQTFHNLKILASIMQHLVLSLFVRTGRSGQEAVVDDSEIMARRQGVTLGLRNDDGVSQGLYNISDFEGSSRLLQPFLEDMREQLRLWAEDLLRLAAKTRLN
jgi:hypothetical protein